MGLGKLPRMDGKQMKSADVVIQTEDCSVHSSFVVALKVNGGKFEREMVEGAFESFLNTFGCTVCAAEGVGATLKEYLDIFAKRFLPLLRMQFPKMGDPTFTIQPPEPPTRLSYG